MAEALAAHCKPDLVLTSDYVRATQTADIVVQTLEEIHGRQPRHARTTALRPETTWNNWLEYLNSDAAEFSPNAVVVVVGHQPSISELFAKHLSFDRPLGGFKKAGFGIIALHESFVRGELVAYVPPKFVQRLKDFQ
jgi:phosphohistidine phosphatase SixA